MNKRTVTILTIISMILCGFSAVTLFFLGVGGILNLTSQQDSTPYNLIFTIFSFFIGVILLLVPVLLIVFRKRLVKPERTNPVAPIPPAE